MEDTMESALEVTEITIENKTENISSEFLNTGFDEQTIRAFVGESDDFYIDRWKLAENPAKKVGFIWAAIFVPLAWLGYRKMFKNMFLYTFATYVGLMVVAFLSAFISSGNESITAGAVFVYSLSIRLYLTLYGNSIYYKHVVSKLKKLQDSNLEKETFSEKVKKIGGVSAYGVILAYAIPALIRIAEIIGTYK